MWWVQQPTDKFAKAFVFLCALIIGLMMNTYLLSNGV